MAPRFDPRGGASDRMAPRNSPSDQLRKWYGHKAEKFNEFRKRFTIELNKEEPRKILETLRERAKKETITLVYGAKDKEHNNAVVLLELVKKSTGPAK